MAVCRDAVCAVYGNIFAYPLCSCIHILCVNFVVCTLNMILKLSVQSPSSYTPQLGSLVSVLREVCTNKDKLLLCDKCAVWKFTDTSEAPSSYEVSTYTYHSTQ